jgi:hypothetical protein
MRETALAKEQSRAYERVVAPSDSYDGHLHSAQLDWDPSWTSWPSSQGQKSYVFRRETFEIKSILLWFLGIIDWEDSTFYIPLYPRTTRGLPRILGSYFAPGKHKVYTNSTPSRISCFKLH